MYSRNTTLSITMLPAGCSSHASDPGVRSPEAHACSPQLHLPVLRSRLLTAAVRRQAFVDLSCRCCCATDCWCNATLSLLPGSPVLRCRHRATASGCVLVFVRRCDPQSPYVALHRSLVRRHAAQSIILALLPAGCRSHEARTWNKQHEFSGLGRYICETARERF